MPIKLATKGTSTDSGTVEFTGISKKLRLAVKSGPAREEVVLLSY